MIDIIQKKANHLMVLFSAQEIASKEIMMNFYVGQTKHNTHVKQVV